MSSSVAWPPAPECDADRTCVLVVEDELLIRIMLAEGLRDEGYHVIEACNADEALVILESAVPDLLISDVRMPGSLDGIELLRVVKEKLSALPVIIISGHLDPTLAVAEGAAQFVAKPYTIDVVVDAVRDVLAVQ